MVKKTKVEQSINDRISETFKVTDQLYKPENNSADKTVIITLRLKQSERRAIKSFCAKNDLNMSDFIKRGIAELQTGISTGKYKILNGQIITT